MADIIYTREGLVGIGDEYTGLATSLKNNIDTLGGWIEMLASSGVKGEEAPTTLLNLWNGGGDQQGVYAAMQSYSSKLNEASANLYVMAERLGKTDAALSEASSDLVQVQSSVQ